MPLSNLIKPNWFVNLYEKPGQTEYEIGPIGFPDGVVKVLRQFVLNILVEQPQGTDLPGLSDEDKRQIAELVVLAPKMFETLLEIDQRGMTSDLGYRIDAFRRQIGDE